MLRYNAAHGSYLLCGCTKPAMNLVLLKAVLYLRLETYSHANVTLLPRTCNNIFAQLLRQKIYVNDGS